jgi:hypothetical protein
MSRSSLGQSLLLSTMFVAAFAATAFAQGIASFVTTPGGQAHITLNINGFVQSPSDNSDQSLKAEEDGRRMIYDLAGHECGILRDTIASDCRIESININILRLGQNPNLGQRPDGFNVNASIVLRIVPK